MISRGVVVGDYVADPVVERVLLVKLKAVEALNAAHDTHRIDYRNTFGPARFRCSISA